MRVQAQMVHAWGLDMYSRSLNKPVIKHDTMLKSMRVVPKVMHKVAVHTVVETKCHNVYTEIASQISANSHS